MTHTVPGVRLVGRYGANAQHTLFLLLEADDVDAIHKFLWPGFKRCTSTITPVSEVPVPRTRVRRTDRWSAVDVDIDECALTHADIGI